MAPLRDGERHSVNICASYLRLADFAMSAWPWLPEPNDVYEEVLVEKRAPE